jgi:hypothetical protein
MDVYGRILQAWMPAIHAGMTEKEPVMCPTLVMFWGRA